MNQKNEYISQVNKSPDDKSYLDDMLEALRIELECFIRNYNFSDAIDFNKLWYKNDEDPYNYGIESKIKDLLNRFYSGNYMKLKISNIQCKEEKITGINLTIKLSLRDKYIRGYFKLVDPHFLEIPHLINKEVYEFYFRINHK